MAALQGVDLDEAEVQSGNEPKKPLTADDIKARAVARLTGDKNLAGAISEGLTPEMGIEYKIAEGTEIG